MRLISLAALVLCMAVVGCTKQPAGPTVWIYTSTFNQVVQDYKADLSKKFPGVTFQWFTAGSENVAAKVNAELLSGKTQADIIMTSDLFWFEDLKQKKALLAYESPATSKVPDRYKDPDHFWGVSRLPAIVIAYHSEVYSQEVAPKSFADLTLPRFKDKVAMGSPLESGTTFTAVSMIARNPRLGWEYFAKLRSNGAISTGGNSAVMSRIESKERPVGIVLLENILAVQKRNPKITIVYPTEGIILVPSPVAITAGTSNPELSKKVYDYFFSADGQEIMRRGFVHSSTPEFSPPDGSISYSELIAKSMPWDGSTLHEVKDKREQIKSQFSKVMLE